MRSVLNERRAALDAVHLVAFLQQELGQIRAVLAGDAGDQRLLAQDSLRRGAHIDLGATIRQAAAKAANVRGCNEATVPPDFRAAERGLRILRLSAPCGY